MVKVFAISNKVIFLIIVLQLLSTQTTGQIIGEYRSAGSGTWNYANTWECYNYPNKNNTWQPAQTAPNEAAKVTIKQGHTVSLLENGICKSLKIDGILDFSKENRTLFIGAEGIAIAPDSKINGSGKAIITTKGNLIINSTYISASIIFIIDADCEISGNGIVSKIIVNNGKTITNTGSLTITNLLQGQGTWKQAEGSKLFYTGDNFDIDYVDAISNTNTIYFCKNGAQTIPEFYYTNLVIDGAGTKTAGGNITMLDTLTIQSKSEFNMDKYNLTSKSDFINNGSFIQNSGAVIFNGITTIYGSSTTSFCHVIIKPSAILNGKASGSFCVGGNWDNNGTFYHNNGTVIIKSCEFNTLLYGNSITNFNNLIIESGSGLTINTNNTVNAVNLTINTPLDDGASGSLITYGVLNVSGQTKINRYITADTWWYIASPVSNATSKVFDATNKNNAYGLFYNNEANNIWTAIDTTNALQPMKGYGYKIKTERGGASKTIVFNGIPNNGYQSIMGLTSGGVGGGYNLVGNPFPSSVDWCSTVGWTKTNIKDEIRYRSKGTYATFNANSKLGINGGQSIIPPMQAFWVEVIGAIGTLAVTNDARMHSTHNMYREAKDQGQILRIKCITNGLSDETIIGFIAGSATYYDDYDTQKYYEPTTAYPILYTQTKGHQLAVNVLPELIANSCFDLGFATNVTSTFSFNFNIGNNFDDQTIIILEDAETHIFQNLKINSTYTFSSGICNSTNRFKIYFNKTTEQKNGLLTTLQHNIKRNVLINSTVYLKGNIYNALEAAEVCFLFKDMRLEKEVTLISL